MRENFLKMFSQRLNEFIINYLKITPYALEKSIDVSNGAISKAIANGKTIGMDTLEKIFIKYPDLNLEWLISGNGEMTKRERKNEILSGQKLVNSSVEAKESTIIYDDPLRNIPGSIPFFEWRQGQGGPVTVYNDTNEIPSTYIYSPGFEDCTFACRVSGDSMEDRIKSGDIIACKEINNRESISFGDIFLVVTAEYRLVKIIRRSPKVGWIILRSYNKDFDDMDMRMEEVLNLYLVKGVIKKTHI
ncbi:S24 family peptidase [Dyadobacter sp. LHD-138]|uniref:S24 family peptidase n=1 Tax=Dyadobacter sp. LHD-138 TaxID=3071413 RepID=UPI0027DF2629|nr:S24 family peptidase [Dyadobacter sp. LHD-138]MDQ6477842.1 S24 family peptidase [Dyadobacter sp. LHD-138]